MVIDYIFFVYFLLLLCIKEWLERRNWRLMKWYFTGDCKYGGKPISSDVTFCLLLWSRFWCLSCNPLGFLIEHFYSSDWPFYFLHLIDPSTSSTCNTVCSLGVCLRERGLFTFFNDHEVFYSNPLLVCFTSSWHFKSSFLSLGFNHLLLTAEVGRAEVQVEAVLEDIIPGLVLPPIPVPSHALALPGNNQFFSADEMWTLWIAMTRWLLLQGKKTFKVLRVRKKLYGVALGRMITA